MSSSSQCRVFVAGIPAMTGQELLRSELIMPMTNCGFFSQTSADSQQVVLTHFELQTPFESAELNCSTSVIEGRFGAITAPIQIANDFALGIANRAPLLASAHRASLANRAPIKQQKAARAWGQAAIAGCSYIAFGARRLSRRRQVVATEPASSFLSPRGVGLSVAAALILLAGSPAIAANCSGSGSLRYVGLTNDLSRSVWLSVTSAGAFELESAKQGQVVDSWNPAQAGPHISRTTDVSNGNGGTHKLYDVSNGNKPCLLDTQNQKAGIILPPGITRPPFRPRPPIGPPQGIMPTLPVRPVPPIAILPPIGTLPPQGLMPTVPVQPVPPIGTLPPQGLMPTVPVQPVPPIGTLPPQGLMPTVPVQPVPPIGTLPPQGLMPTVPVQPVPPIGTLPPQGLMPTVPVQPVPPIGTLPPQGLMPTVPVQPVPPIGTLPPQGLMPTVPVQPVPPIGTLPPQGLMPTVPVQPVPPIVTLPPQGLMPTVPVQPVPPIGTLPPQGLMPTVPVQPVPPIGTLPPQGLMPTVPVQPVPPIGTLPPQGLMPTVPVQPVPPEIPLGEVTIASSAGVANVPKTCIDPNMVDPNDVSRQTTDWQCPRFTAPLTEGRDLESPALWDFWVDLNRTLIHDNRTILQGRSTYFNAVAGIDRLLGDGIVAGVSIAIDTSQSASADGLLNATSNGTIVNPYLAVQLGNHWALDFGYSYNWADNDVSVGPLRGGFASHSHMISADLSGEYVFGRSYVRPGISLTRTWASLGQTTLAGQVIGEAVDTVMPSRGFNVGTGEIHSEFGHAFHLGGTKALVPWAELSLVHLFGQPADAGDFLGSSSASWSGAVRVGARLQISPTSMIELSAGYMSIGQQGLDVRESRIFATFSF